MNILNITKENFGQEVLRSAKPVLVDFWAPWCGYCRRLGPVIDWAAEAYEGKLQIGKINIDEQPELAEQFQVDTIPTLIMFQGGKAGEPIIATEGKGQLTAWLAQQGIS